MEPERKPDVPLSPEEYLRAVARSIADREVTPAERARIDRIFAAAAAGAANVRKKPAMDWARLAWARRRKKGPLDQRVPGNLESWDQPKM